MRAVGQWVGGIALAFCIGVAGSHAAESWPVRPVRLIVPFGPGGATDIVSRLLQPSLNETLGQQLVVDNRPGAYGNIAAELAARAAPDGYTIFIANVSVASINPTLFAGRLKVDIPKELTGVTVISSSPEEFRGFVDGQLKRWQRIIKENNVKID